MTQEFDSHFQAVLITTIALWALGDRLFRSWHPGLAWLIFVTGLQGLYPLYALVPVTVQDTILARVAAIAGTTGYKPAFLSFLVLPYWWLTLWATDFLRQRLESDTPQESLRKRSPSQLVPLVERMALGLGGVLTLFTLANPCLRTAFLVCIGVTLLFRLRRQPSPLLTGLTHSVGLGAIASGIDYGFPTLPPETWAMVCLIGMLAEFGGAAYGRGRWEWSCWWAGLTLATIAYLCLLGERSLF